MNLQTLNHVPTQEQRKLVESTSGIGLPYNEIAALVGIDEYTLQENYERELELGQAKANGQIAKAIYAKALNGDAASLKLWSENQDKIKRGRGRPKGTFKIKRQIQEYERNPDLALPKTDNARIKDLKDMLIRSSGKDVVEKMISIALNDNHPAQMAAIKMCVDRTLPVSMFEKDKSQRSAITINITGIGAPTVATTTIDQEEPKDIEDIEAKDG